MLSLADIFQDEMGAVPACTLRRQSRLLSATLFLGYLHRKNALPGTAKGRRGKNLTNPTFLTEPS
jgi:hypothetical protein